MSYATHINQTPGFRYIDEDELIEYAFVGFETPLTIEDRIELIRKYGTPRKSPKENVIQGKGFTITLDKPASAYEMQIIGIIPPE